MKKFTRLAVLTAFTFLLCFQMNGWGQLLQWNTFGNTGTETTEPSVFNNANLSSTNLTQGSITAAANGNRFGGSGWFNTGNTVAGNTLSEAIAGNDYIQFIVTPNAGYSFTPTSFAFQWDKSGTGPKNVALRSSVDGFAADLGIIAPVTAIGTVNTITISGLTSITTATTFRLYGYGATATGGTGGFDVSSNVVNVQLNGTTASIGSLTPPALTADATNNNVDNDIDITFTDDATWRTAITAVKIGTLPLAPGDYTISSGVLKLQPSNGNSLLTTSGLKSVVVVAFGYNDATVAQQINAGVPTTNSAASISAILAAGITRTITCTAKDQYNNLVAGYFFKYDATLTNSDPTTGESYTLDGSAITSSALDVNVVSVTNSSGVATFSATLPALIDANDGISIQVQLANGSTNIGSAFSYVQVPPQITLTGADPSSSSYQQGISNNILYSIKVDLVNNSCNLTALDAITNGNYVGADILTNGFKLWYSTDATFGGDVSIGSTSSTSTGTGEIVSFTGLSQLFPVGTSYLFITADFVATATIGNNISCESTTNSDLTFTSNPTFSGSSFTAANLHSIIVGPTILQPGDISFIGYGNDTPDKFAFIVLKNLNDNTSITFTDNAWTGTALATNENTGTYTVPSGGLLIGSIVHIEGTTVIGGGTMSAGLSGLAIDGDQILAYQGSSATPNFLAGVSSTGWLTSGSTNSNSSYLPSALALYVSAIGFSSEEDNGYYSGPMTLANGAVAAFICNPANWTRSSTVQTFPAWSFTLGNHTLVDVTSTVQNLNILNIESLTIDASKQLTVAGNLVLESDATGTGSLIDNGTLVSTNNTVERFITKYNAEGDDMYHFLSSPVALQNISTEFSNPPANSTDDFFKFDEATYMWINFRDNTGNEINGSFGDSYKFVVGKGYLVAYNADVTKSFTGTLNTSTISAPAMTYTSTLSNPGWNLIGNPYPSAIDWDLVATGQYANMDNAVYVYDNASATYKSYVDGIGNLTDGIIPAMQGFFVHASTASPTLSLENADRVHGGATYYKNGTLENVVRLKVVGNNRYDETFIRFNDEASTGFDASLDAFKLYGGSSVPTFYTLADDRKLSVNSLPTSSLEGFVPLAVEAGAANTYSISLIENGLPASTYVTLEDTKTGSLQRLNDQPTYSFTAAPGEDPNRFRLHFKDATLVADPSSSADFTAYAINGQLNVLSSVSGKLSITDMSGKTLSIRNITKGELNTVSLNGATGLYLVKISTSQGNFIQKVVVK